MRLVSPLLSLDYRRTATVGSYWRGMGEAHNFIYSMNSLRSNSISYLVAQPKVETRYNQKNLHAFQPFRAEPKVIDRREIMPTCLPA